MTRRRARAERSDTADDDVFRIERRGEDETRLDVEPGGSVRSRGPVRVLSRLPIEWLR